MRTTRALFFSLSVYIVLNGAFFLLWTQFTVIQTHVVSIFLGVILFLLAFLAASLFQSLKISAQAEKIAGHLVKDALSSSQELFVQLFRHSPVPYVLIDEKGKVSSANTSAVRLFGTREGSLDGADIFTHIEGDNAQHVALFLGKFTQGLFVNDEEVRIRRFDEGYRWVLCSLFSFKDVEGKRTGLLTLVDISKQKQIDQAKTEFVSLASHQLRTPIAAMKWNMELLLTKYGDVLAPEERVYIDKAVRNVKNMDMLVGDFLNAARFELGTLVAENTQIEAPTFFNEIIEEHRGHAETKKIHLVQEEDSSILSLTSDVRLLRMVVSNLVSNAIKYTPDNGTVSVRTRGEAGNIVITVSDTGMGIPKDEQERLFSKIFRASNAQAQVPDGTGLGLYIVDQAVKVLGGTITFKSEENEGTTFTVTLPRGK